MRLWETTGTSSVDKAILVFTAGEDPILDRFILPYDCIASAAHVEMLATIGILTDEERRALRDALTDAFVHATDGTLLIKPEQEDGHTALEAYLTEHAGEAGKKVHTGRSRNDQVIAALRLFVRERLLELTVVTRTLVEVLLTQGCRHTGVLMPGYTHTRQAMPSTMGQLFFAGAEGIIRAIESFNVPLSQANRSPLGSASGYGVPLPLQRQQIAELLGLDDVDTNTLHIQNTRGLLEASVLFALHQVSLVLSRLAADLIAMSSEALGFVRLPMDICTGSSIMPQKKNPDVLELVRAQPATLLGRYASVTGMLHGLLSGYHRDLQCTKGPMVRSLIDVHAAIVAIKRAIDGLEVDAQRCRAAMTDEIFATDSAFAHVRAGLSFRDAYRKVKEEGAGALNADSVMANRNHLGAPGTDQSDRLRHILNEVSARWARFEQGAQHARRLVMAPQS